MKSNFYKKKKSILIAGPTASGKSDLAYCLAKKIKGEIINADSMQVYKNFPILTSQPEKIFKKEIKHHLYNFYDTNDSYNGVLWLKQASLCIQRIYKNDKVPIVVGGSGLYLEFLLDGIHAIPNVTRTAKDKVCKKLKTIGLNQMYEELKKIDYKYAKKVSKNDKHRIMRGLEVFYSTKKIISYYYKKKKMENNFNFFKVLLMPKKEIIKENCQIRFEKMIQKGLISEIENNKNNVKNCNIVNAIGYKEILNFLDNKLNLEDAKKFAINNTRKYAKRQITWFRNRFNADLEITSKDNNALILESFFKIN